MFGWNYEIFLRPFLIINEYLVQLYANSLCKNVANLFKILLFLLFSPFLSFLNNMLKHPQKCQQCHQGLVDGTRNLFMMTRKSFVLVSMCAEAISRFASLSDNVKLRMNSMEVTFEQIYTRRRHELNIEQIGFAMKKRLKKTSNSFNLCT